MKLVIGSNGYAIDGSVWDDLLISTAQTTSPHDHLVSNGSTHINLVPVVLYLNGTIAQLTLVLPVPFEDGRFVENDDGSDFMNPGRAWNRAHESFSNQVQFDSLSKVRQAIERGADVVVILGYYDRLFRMIDMCSSVSTEDAPLQGEAADVWSRFEGTKTRVKTTTKISNPTPVHWTSYLSKSIPFRVTFSNVKSK